MKKFLAQLIPLLLFFNFLSNAQIKTEVYHNYINQAEIHIINHEEFDALKCYTNAFKIQKPFAYDIYNAIVCAIHIKNDTTAMRYCYQLALKGVGELFFKKAIFKNLEHNKRWPDILQIAKNTKENIVKKNQCLLSKLDTLSEIDQKTALLNRTLISTPDIEVWNQVIKSTDSLSNELLKIYQTEDYLSEDKLGVARLNDTVILPNHKWDVIIRHAFQGGAYKYKQAFINILRDGLLEGKINPHSLKMYMNFTSSFGFSMDESKTYMQLGCKLYKNFQDEYYVWTMNQFRRDFFLCSLSDFEAKVLYNVNNPNTDFCIAGSPHQITKSFDNEEDKQFFLSLYKEMDFIIINCK